MEENMIEIEGRFWSPTQVAASLRVSTATVRGWCAAGELGHIRLGKTIRVSDRDLRRFLQRRSVPTLALAGASR